jgi:hypothetical protein
MFEAVSKEDFKRDVLAAGGVRAVWYHIHDDVEGWRFHRYPESVGAYRWRDAVGVSADGIIFDNDFVLDLGDDVSVGSHSDSSGRAFVVTYREPYGHEDFRVGYVLDRAA